MKMAFDIRKKKVFFVALVAILASVCVTSDFLGYDYFLMVKVNDLHNKLYNLIVNRIGLDENLIMSSFSLHAVMSMLTLGARGDTELELNKALGYPRSDFLIESYKLATKELKKVRGVTINMANRIYVRNDLTLNGNFSRTAIKVFSAGAERVDFANRENAAKTINTWVENKTNKKIKNLIAPDMLDASTALVLVNALYFKGFWDKPFDPKLTVSEKFTTLAGNQVDVEMMHQKSEFLYGSFPDKNIQVLEMDYKMKNISMIIILPDDTIAFKEFEKLDSINLNTLYLENMKVQKVSVGVPKFKIETKLNLNDYLPKLGFQSIFKGSADFSGLITKNEPLQVTHVIQKAFIEVNELGTEAAAATAVTLGRSISFDPIFTCDRSFLYFIVKKPLGKILFAGRKVA